jgi:hypothetical protein
MCRSLLLTLLAIGSAELKSVRNDSLWTVFPTMQRLQLALPDPNADGLNCTGRTWIDVAVRAPTGCIVLNSVAWDLT